MNIGSAIIELRKRQKVTRVELAQRCGISATGLYNLEKNKSFPPKDTIERICSSLGYSVSTLMVWSLTEEDVPENKRQAFHILIDPIKQFLISE